MKLELNISKKVKLRHPDDVEGHRLVKEKFLENIKEFLPEQQEADMQEERKTKCISRGSNSRSRNAWF